jgi:hypothetical protein
MVSRWIAMVLEALMTIYWILNEKFDTEGREAEDRLISDHSTVIRTKLSCKKLYHKALYSPTG